MLMDQKFQFYGSNAIVSTNTYIFPHYSKWLSVKGHSIIQNDREFRLIVRKKHLYKTIYIDKGTISVCACVSV